MKKQNLILSLFLLGVLLGVTACGDDEAGKASKAEVKAAFESANNEISSDITEFTTSSGNEAMDQLSTLTGGSLPFGRKSSRNRTQVIDNVKAGVYAIRGILTHSTANARVASDEPFDFDENKGVYEWDPQEEDFVQTGESTIIEIWFPTEGSLTNNAEFRMTAYDEELTPNGDELYSPTLIKASIFVNETKELEVNAEVEYGDEDEPVKGDVYYFVNPFAFEASFDDTQSKSSTFSESLSESGQVLIGFGGSVNYSSSAKMEEDISSASAYIQIVDLKFSVSAKASNATVENPYDAINITVKVKNKVGGKIIIDEDENVYMKYNDKSTEPLELLFADLISEIDEID